MRAVILDQPGSQRIGDRPDPTPKAGEVVVRVHACGICGTDLHILDGEFPPTPYPITPGHEFAGEIVELGADVTGLAVSDRVAVDPSLFCGRCWQCQRQRGNLCENWGAIGDTVDGAFAEYVAVPAGNCYRLPDSVDYNAGALVEPVACAVHAIHRLNMAVGSSLLVVGAGTMGLLLMQLAQSAGAYEVAMVDRDPARLTLAAQLGAAVTATSVEKVVDEHRGRFQYVVEATGVAAAGQAALGAVESGGTFMVFGVAPEDARLQVSPFDVYNREISVVGSMAVLSTFAPAVKAVASGVIDTARMVTHVETLDRFADAIQLTRQRAGLKVQVKPS
ncbi:zinc-dependent alcohol dehydrogenase family protein [Micromonospora sp. NPDC005206]|uniref:zinc-dependent alcohol dehydrogenase family protein n=1 Tax=Micromonospora sp. NPDC005206 TaxID=3157022 RepID=UPI0033A7E22B